ncbi:hypothetical protein XELAEV_18030134mg [Xenopus laevis]|uniref:Uncharacterized protein n=1 Tax=Xenopus laevis TaxID=8355 RepID=A0A974HIG8_XENLA|nr:hypothetical protein XELAEV_18030134mg [Xenopus laevis]
MFCASFCASLESFYCLNLHSNIALILLNADISDCRKCGLRESIYWNSKNQQPIKFSVFKNGMFKFVGKIFFSVFVNILSIHYKTNVPQFFFNMCAASVIQNARDLGLSVIWFTIP